jgi:hypothetical protein
VVASDADDEFLESVSPKTDLTSEANVTGALVGALRGAFVGAATTLATPLGEELLTAETLTTPLIVSM